MNYIREINAFYDRLETNPLSTSAIALWHALMHINNKAAWIDTFAVAVSVLCVKTGLSERTITNARNELKQRGYIDFQSRKGNRSATYKMIRLSEIVADKFSGNNSVSAINADSVSDSVSYSLSDSVSDNLSALNKQNKTKQNEKEAGSNNAPAHDDFYPVMPLEELEQPEFTITGQISRTFEEIYGRAPNLTQIAELARYVERDGMDVELIAHAIKQARLAGQDLRYALGIAESWAQKGIRTVAAAKEEEQAFMQRRGAVRKHPSITGGKVGWVKPTHVDKLPASVQKQLELEKTGAQSKSEGRLIKDDPVLAAMLHDLRTGGKG
jgi:DnaD/phage-associated family protein